MGDREVVSAVEENTKVLYQLLDAQIETNRLLNKLGATVAQKVK